MNVMGRLNKGYKVLVKEGKEKEEKIQELLDYYEDKVPEDYIGILREATEIEIEVKGSGYIAIWGVHWCLIMNDIYHIQEELPGTIAVAGDTGGGCLLYMEGVEGYGLYYIRYEDLDKDSAIYVAHNLRDMLLNGEGVGVVENI